MGARQSKRREIHYADVADAIHGSGTAPDPVALRARALASDSTGGCLRNSPVSGAKPVESRDLRRRSSDPGPQSDSYLLPGA